MTTTEIILNLVDYELWCNFHILDFLEGLSEEERNRDFGFGLRTPHQTMVHIAKVMQEMEPLRRPNHRRANLARLRSTGVAPGGSTDARVDGLNPFLRQRRPLVESGIAW